MGSLFTLIQWYTPTVTHFMEFLGHSTWVLVHIALFSGLCFAADPFVNFELTYSFITASPLGVPQQVWVFDLFCVFVFIFSCGFVSVSWQSDELVGFSLFPFSPFFLCGFSCFLDFVLDCYLSAMRFWWFFLMVLCFFFLHNLMFMFWMRLHRLVGFNIAGVDRGPKFSV